MPQSETSLSSIDLSHLGLLQISGEGAQKLLQGQLTCNVEEISGQQTRLGAYCQPQGRMLSLFRLFQYQGAYYLQMPAEIMSATLEVLKKYAVFFKVNLQDASHILKRVSYSGTQAEVGLKKIFNSLPMLADSAHTQDNLLIIKLPGAVPHYEIIGTAEAFTQFPPTDSAINSWKYLNISAGIPNIYSATVSKFLPQEVNLITLNGVSFSKGCYTGQEIVARMHYRGQLKKQMFRGRVNSSAAPAPGADIFNAKTCGILVDSCQEDENTWQILFVADKNTVENEQLFLDPAKIAPIELLALPE
jgi:folate-binding protein YgfZ